MHHLLTIASDEFETATLGRRWLPLEDQDDPEVIGKPLLGDRDCWAPHGIMLGDAGSLYLFTCTGCADRPLAARCRPCDDGGSPTGEGDCRVKSQA